MDYSKIKILSKQKRISIKEISDKIGMTEAGLHQAIKNDTLKIKDLEKIAEVLEVPISYFFGDEEASGYTSNKELKEKYDKLMEENRNLHKKIIWLMKRNFFLQSAKSEALHSDVPGQ